jgi:WhiB family redox-sensing transcriptional regulator
VSYKRDGLPKIPVAIDTPYDWRDSAACLGHEDPELWFRVPNHEGTRKRLNVRQQADIDEAKRICAGCRVLAECHKAADALSDGWGVWAALTGEERKLLKRRKQKAESKARTRATNLAYDPPAGREYTTKAVLSPGLRMRRPV